MSRLCACGRPRGISLRRVACAYCTVGTVTPRQTRREKRSKAARVARVRAKVGRAA